MRPFDKRLVAARRSRDLLAKHTGKEKLLFSHISKAGGTSFHDLAVANKS